MWAPKRAPDPILIGPNLFKMRSEEECLLGRVKYGLNMHPIHNRITPTNIGSKNEPHKAGRRKRIYDVQGEITTAALNAGRLLF